VAAQMGAHMGNVGNNGLSNMHNINSMRMSSMRVGMQQHHVNDKAAVMTAYGNHG
jgi:hypothetical protein